MPPCPNPNVNVVDDVVATPTTPPAAASPTISTNSDTKATKEGNTNKNRVVSNRPFPFNICSDTTYLISGSIILTSIVVPSLLIIALANIVGYLLQKYLWDEWKLTHNILSKLRYYQQNFFKKVAKIIMLTEKDSSYIPWMIINCIIQPLLFLWIWKRFDLNGGFEILPFLLYHLIRVGPKHQCFAHHCTLVHKEGHAHVRGLYCNPFIYGGLDDSKKKPLPKQLRRSLFDHINAMTAGLLYGTITNHYATAHNKIHHRWHNDTGDVHTNMDFDRTSLKSYVMYLPRFVGYWTGISPLLLFWYRGEYTLLRSLSYGMIYYYTITLLVLYVKGPIFYFAYILYPMLESASFLGLIAYLWHMFSDPSDPTNQYINSITILRGGSNIWNEDYHVVHHHEPNLHWTLYTKSFEDNINKYKDCMATIFGDCEQGLLINWIFSKDWITLTNHFVDLSYVFSDGTKNIDINKRLTMKDIRLYEKKLSSSSSNIGRTDDELDIHFNKIKDMLLIRLQYHYMGTRKDEKNKKTNNNNNDDDNEDFHKYLDNNVRTFGSDNDSDGLLHNDDDSDSDKKKK